MKKLICLTTILFVALTSHIDAQVQQTRVLGYCQPPQQTTQTKSSGYIGELPGLRWDASVNAYREVSQASTTTAMRSGNVYNAPVYNRSHPNARQGWTGDLRRHLSDRNHGLSQQQISRMSARDCVNRHEIDHGFPALYPTITAAGGQPSRGFQCDAFG